jgi:hypothetical protein
MDDSHLPSRVTTSFWLFAQRQRGTYPAPTDNCGKWLIFSPISEIDQIWGTIKTATEQGLLGCSSKVATAKVNPNAQNPDEKVICVYTYDSNDVEDVKRVRQQLRELGFTRRLSYKTDAATHSGEYAVRGHKGISLYYE